MPNINNYLEWRGDLKLENDPLNEVDNMILSRFSYMPFNKIEISEDETMGSIAEKIKEKFNIDINKKKIVINDPIKNLGTYTVNVKLYEGVVAKLKITVVGM